MPVTLHQFTHDPMLLCPGSSTFTRLVRGMQSTPSRQGDPTAWGHGTQEFWHRTEPPQRFHHDGPLSIP